MRIAGGRTNAEAGPGTVRHFRICLRMPHAGATTDLPPTRIGRSAMNRKLKLTVAAVMTAVVTTLGVSTATTGVAVAKNGSLCC